jgi:hypothetical protein
MAFECWHRGPQDQSVLRDRGSGKRVSGHVAAFVDGVRKDSADWRKTGRTASGPLWRLNRFGPVAQNHSKHLIALAGDTPPGFRRIFLENTR